ncbi:MAG TPA: hypothetical protein VL400_19970 [Polyangiaceae bacterium]|nr:hypothetical protein [Polyangiaceae bacterium]
MSFAFVVPPALRPGGLLRGVALALATSLAAVAVGCQSADGDIFSADGDGTEKTSVRFTHDGVLELSPGETVTVDIETKGGATVGVLLLGDAFDAALDRTSVRADSNGHASVELRAPTQPSTFRLRAQVGDVASAELSVAVSDSGFGSVRVLPKYEGNRVLDGWVASVTVGTSCDSVLGGFPVDPPGALTTEASVGTQPIVNSVPVGPSIAVAIRSGALVAGCTTTTLDTPSKTVDVDVDVLNRPMVLGDAVLDVTLGFSTDDPGYTSLVAAGTDLVAGTAFPQAEPAATLLLDAMAANIADPDDLAAFEDLRASAGLDDSIGASLGSFHPYDVCTSLSAQAVSIAGADASSASLDIEGRLTGTAESPAAPTFEPTTFAGIDAGSLSIPSAIVMSWSTTPTDGLVIGGAVPFSPTALAAHFMNAAAADLVAPGVTASNMIASGYDCPSIAYDIGAFGSCDLACVESLCGTAIEARWQLGAAASDDGGAPSGVLTITVSGQSAVDANVVPVDLEGTWVGSLEGLSESVGLSGAASGQAPPPG